MDFPRYPEWHTSFLYYIQPIVGSDNPALYALAEGDILRVGCPGVKEFRPTVMVRSLILCYTRYCLRPF